MVEKPRLFRDPVHDTIALPRDTALGRLLIDLLDTREMQRLRRIRQLGLTSVVYPGAEHSRFQHSLGVLWLAHQMVERLSRHHAISDEERELAVIGALLHDVGHGPMSHALEAVTGVRHERWTEALILAPDTELGRVLRARAPDLPERVVTLFGKGPLPSGIRPFVRDIVSSQLDADRLDYILRDGRATGVRIGHYDIERILALIEIADGHLAVHAGAQEAVEGYLLARFHMYKQVYLHKTSRTAERMLEAALRRAAHLGSGPSRPAYWPSGPLGDLIAGRALSPTAFATLDDSDIWLALKAWASDSDRWLAALAGGIVHRHLYKPLALPEDPARADELVQAARSIARVNGYDPAEAVLVDSSRDSLYKPFIGAKKQLDGGSIRIVDNAGRCEAIEERSLAVRMLATLEVNQRLVCVHPDLKTPIQRALRGR
jgi:HD superfamily phosphohydrolase